MAKSQRARSAEVPDAGRPHIPMPRMWSCPFSLRRVGYGLPDRICSMSALSIPARNRSRYIVAKKSTIGPPWLHLWKTHRSCSAETALLRRDVGARVPNELNQADAAVERPALR